MCGVPRRGHGVGSGPFGAPPPRWTAPRAHEHGERGEPVGIAYGHPLGADTGWWDQLTEPVPDAMRREDGHRTFGLMGLAVRERWRGQGIARRLHETLLDGVEAERVLLNVHPESEVASAAYRAWGYRTVGQARPREGTVLYDVMLLALR